MSKRNKYDMRDVQEELEVLVAHDYSVIEFSEYHYRINDCLDIWPTRRKYYMKGGHQAYSYNGAKLSEFVMEEIFHECPKTE